MSEEPEVVLTMTHTEAAYLGLCAAHGARSIAEDPEASVTARLAALGSAEALKRLSALVSGAEVEAIAKIQERLRRAN